MRVSRSTWLHLRIPFSVFLMPVFSFAASQAAGYDIWNFLLVFLILHLFLYPASNGFNSFYDKDEESIGGLEKPPTVTSDLLVMSLLFDAVAVLLGFIYGWEMAFMLFFYGLASKAYSHPAIRFKRYPISGLLIVGIFQGGFTYLMVFLALDGTASWSNYYQPEVLIPAALTSVMLVGSYPMTQIYQHFEDAKRGDITISMLLGIKGTFLFTGIAFALTNLGFLYYFMEYQNVNYFLVFQLFLAPTAIYFFQWYRKVLKNPKEANFKNTMMLNKVSSVSMIAFFTLITFLKF